MFYRIVVQGIKNRRRDTLALGSVLFLSFFFLTLTAVLLASVTFTEQRSRQELYGSWQWMHYGARDEAVAAYAQAAPEAMAVSRLVGTTAGGSVVATLDEPVLACSGLTLEAGRLPADPGEIALVQGAYGTAALGDTIQVSYRYNYMSVQGDDSVFAPYRQAILDDVQAHRDAWAAELSLPEEVLADPNLTDAMLYAHVTGPGGPWALSVSPRTRNDLAGQDGVNLTCRVKSDFISLSGERFGADRGRILESNLVNESLILYRQYTVTGILTPYADRWDAARYDLPDAFVCPAEADRLKTAVQDVQAERYPFAPAYVPRSIVFFRDPARTARQLGETLLPAYQSVYPGSYRVSDLIREGTEFSGVLTGLDAQTGQERSYPFTGEGEAARVSADGVEASFTLSDLTDGVFLLEGLLPFDSASLTVDGIETGNTGPFRVNTYAYPSQSTSAAPALWGMLRYALALLTACATFQIFWSQLRRRRMRLITLLSIGAQDGQIVRMLLTELGVILLAALPLGTALGMGGAAVLCQTALNAHFTVDGGALAVGLGLGVLAALAGAAVPIALCVHAPLTGQEIAPKRVPPKPRRAGGDPMRRHGYGFVALRSLTANRGRSALGLLFAFLLCAVLVLTLFLSHNALGEYRDRVLYAGRPDYEFKARYAMSRNMAAQTIGQIAQELGVEETDLVYLNAYENVFLDCEDRLSGPKASPILQALRDHPQGNAFFPRENALRTNVYALRTDSPLFEQLCGAVTVGSVDAARFEAGEECILLVPLYRPDGDRAAAKQIDAQKAAELTPQELLDALLAVSTDTRYQDAYRMDTGYAPGDEIQLSSEYRTFSDMYTPQSARVSCRVGAVIYFFPDTGVWPFSQYPMTHVVLSGFPLGKALYPPSNTRMTPSAARGFSLVADRLFPDSYGKTYFYLRDSAPNPETPALRDSAVAHVADDYALTLVNHRVTRSGIQNSAVQNQAMILLLGLAAALIVLMILSSTAVSQTEQERRRTGILQSLGAGRAQLIGGQLLQSLLTALFALALAHALLAAGVGVYAAARQGLSLPLIRAEALGLLRDYPAALHGGVCLTAAALYVLLTVRPWFPASALLPIENIRG